MRYLLDTHLLLWWMNNDPLLSAKVRQYVVNPDFDVAISAVNIWEIGTKHALGRLDIPVNFIAGVLDYPFSKLEITFAHAWAASQLPFIHKDPFDRLLVAQSQLESRILLTVDKLLLDYAPHIELA